MKKILLIILSFAAFIACDKENHDQKIVPGTSGSSVSITEAVIAPLGNEAEAERIAFTVTSDVPWEIHNKPEWLKVSPVKGKAGTTSVTMFAGINNQPAPVRSCRLSIDATDMSFSETLEVSQERPYLKVSREKIDFAWNQCEAFKTEREKITVRSNTDWEIVVTKSPDGSVSTDDGGTLVEWLSCSELRGNAVEEEHPIYFNPATYNIDREAKSLELEIRGVLDSYKLAFTQANLLFTVDVVDSEDDTRCDFPACNTEEVTLAIESDLDWRVHDKPDWVYINTNSGKNSSDVKFHIDGANPDSLERAGNLVFIIDAGTDPLPQRIIEIRQKGYIFGVEPESASISNNDLSVKEFVLASSGSWEIAASSVPEWLYVPVMTGTGSESGETLAFSAKSRNLDFENRSAKVEFHSTQAGNTMSQSVDIQQDKFIFDADASTLSIGSFQTSLHNLTIHSSGDWAIDVSYAGSPEANWLNFDKLQGEGDAVIKYNAKTGNPLDEDRSAVVSVKSMPHIAAGMSDVVKSFDIVQSKYIFEVKPAPEELTLAYNAVDSKSVSISVNCSLDWMIECPDWLTPSQKNGSNNATVTFKAQNNTALAERNGKLTIKSTYLDNTRAFSFDVTQSAFEFNSDAVEFANIEPLEAGTYTVDVVCSGSWELQDCEPWLNASPTSGFGNAKITIRPQDNVETQSRQKTFSVYSILNGLKKNITVSQKQFVFDTQGVTVAEFAAVNPKSAQVVMTESMSTWKITEIPSWVTVTPASGSGAKTLSITPKENVNTSARTATIKVVSDKNPLLFKEINISQEAFVFDTQAVNISEFTSLNPQPAQAVLGESMATWSAKNVPSWVTVTPASGSGAATLTVTPQENLTTSARSATIKVVSDKNPSLFKEINISQEAFVFDTKKATVPEFTATDPTAAKVTLGECMSTWKVTDIPLWVTVTPASGSGAATLTVTPQENLTTSARTAAIKVVSDKNPSLFKEINISQEAFVFDTKKATVPEFTATDPTAAKVTLGECMSTWKVTDIPSWVTVTPVSGSGAATLTVTPQENMTTSARTATIKVVSDKAPEFVKEISVSQAAFVFDTKKATVPEFPATDPTAAKVTLGECTATWKVTGVPSWITVTPVSGSGAATLTVTPQENLTTSARSATIKVVSDKAPEFVKEISVSQAAFVFDTEAVTVPVFDVLNPKSETVTIGDCTGSWNVQNVPAWITVSPNSGTGSGSITVTASPNLASGSRNAKFYVASGKTTAIRKEISVSQNGYVLGANTTSMEIAASNSATTYSIDVNCSGRWKAECDDDWLHPIVAAGTGSGKFTFTVDDNTDSASRETTVKISSLDGYAGTISVKVLQSAASEE